MTKSSKRTAIVMALITVALCAAVIAGATFALFSSSVTNDINVNTGDIAISSTVELTNAWSTSQGGEQDTAENSGSETSLIFPATGGNVSVGEDGRISISGMGLGDGATFSITLDMEYSINMKYSLVLKTNTADDFLRNNLQVTVADNPAVSLADGSVYIIPWTNAASVTDSTPASARVTASFSLSLPWSAIDSAPVGGSSISLALVTSGVQVNALAVSGSPSGSNEYYVTNQDELDKALTAMESGDSVYLAGDESNWTTANISFNENKSVSVYGSRVGTLTVNAPNASIDYYIEYTEMIDSAVVAADSLHIYGEVGSAQVNGGRIVFESESIVAKLAAVPAKNTHVEVEFAQNTAVTESVTVNTSASGSSTNLSIAENVTVPSLSVEGSGKVAIDNNGVIKDSTVDEGSSVTANSKVTDEASLRGALALGGEVTLESNIALNVPYYDTTSLVPILTIVKNTNLNLNGKKIYLSLAPNTQLLHTPAILCVDGATVEINGDGIIDAEAGDNDSYGINIINNGSLTVNSGTIYGAITAIQVQKGTLVIKDGFFDFAKTANASAPAESKKYIINAIDANWKNGSAKITIYGGTFGHNYSVSTEADGKLYLPDGYGVVQEGDYYTVKEIATNPGEEYGEEYLAGSAAALNSLISAGAENIVISADFNIGTAGAVTTGINISNGTFSIDLNGHTLTNVGTGFAFTVSGSGTRLTLKDSSKDSSEKQSGTIYGGKGGNNQALNVSGGATVDIYGGNYTVGPDKNGLGNSCVEVAGLGGTVNIYDGTFSSEAAYNDFYYVLNTTQTQGTTGAIFVYGGKFLHFDPSKGDDSSTGGSNSSVQSSYLAEGYISVQDGEYYVVQKA